MSLKLKKLAPLLIATAVAVTNVAVATAEPPGDDAEKLAWAHQYGHNFLGMLTLADVASATPQQQAAAADLLTRTQAATAVYSDPAKAQAVGYDFPASLASEQKRSPMLVQSMQQVDSGQMGERGPMLHVRKAANSHDGKVLDPFAPEMLMYDYQGHGAWKLTGAVYLATEAYPAAPPVPGGPITRWHYHGGSYALMMHINFVPVDDLAHAYADM